MRVTEGVAAAMTVFLGVDPRTSAELIGAAAGVWAARIERLMAVRANCRSLRSASRLDREASVEMTDSFPSLPRC